MSYDMEIKKSYVNDNEIQNQELLTLDTISPLWAKRLEESQVLPILSLERLRFYLVQPLHICNFYISTIYKLYSLKHWSSYMVSL